MPLPAVNLVQQQDPTIASPRPPSRYPIFLAILALIIALLSLELWHITRAPTNGLSTTLQPKTGGFFQSLSNFIFHSNTAMAGDQNDRINILLLGIGGPGHDGPYLSDTNIILSIKPSTKEVALISVPRDLSVRIPGYGIRKINSADAVGETEHQGDGGDYARQVFADTFSMNIPYYVRIDFKAFQEIIDEVGGITVTVPKGFTDTAFPGPDFSYRTVTFEPGLQTMDGERALDYARSRHGNNGEGSDFARARRQQLILSALKEKMLSAGTLMNPVTVSQILASLASHITTNLDFGQLMYLASIAKDSNGSIKHLVLDNSENGYLVSTTGEDGAYLLVPRQGNFDSIDAAINGIFDATSTAYTEMADAGNTATTTFPGLHIEIQNGTWQAGLASRVKQMLALQGFTVDLVGNAIKRPIDRTTIYVLHPAISQTATNELTQALHAPSATVLPDWLATAYDNPATVANESGIPKYSTADDVLIILGSDYIE